MTSILTNNSAMNALSTLRNINSNLSTTQDRISSGLKVSSAKDNAAYFQISSIMKGDSSSLGAVNEGLTLTKNSVATARLGAESFKELATQFTERLAFAQGAKGGFKEIGQELDELVKQMTTTLKQSTFNGDDMVNSAETAGATADSSVAEATGILTSATKVTTSRLVVTGIARDAGSISATTLRVDTVDLSQVLKDFTALADSFQARAEDTTAVTVDGVPVTQGQVYLQGVLKASADVLAKATEAATSLGLSEKAIENQQSFLSSLVDNLNSGIGSMVDANMEDEATRLQALQVQQQLATQALSIANQGPQNILALFR